MPSLNRMLGLRGARFYVETESGEPVLMFLLYMDASTRDGPRPSTQADAEAHPEAWAAFVAEIQAEEMAEANQAAQNGRDERPHPFRPMITFTDPEGGKPEEPEESAIARKRREAGERGVRA